LSRRFLDKRVGVDVDRVLQALAELVPELLELGVMRERVAALGLRLAGPSWARAGPGRPPRGTRSAGCGRSLVALVGDDREHVDPLGSEPLALLVDTQPQAAPDLLALLHALVVWLSVQIWKTLGLSQPSFKAECAKMKATLLPGSLLIGEAQQALLVLHDELEGVLGLLRVAADLVEEDLALPSWPCLLLGRLAK
jgi:hypothetical protein